jgi:heme-degrading monooxygenase HmoA
MMTHGALMSGGVQHALPEADAVAHSGQVCSRADDSDRKDHRMNHARVGIYTLTGNAAEVTQQATDGMLPLFKRQPGFVDYSIVAADGKLISISTWESLEQANAGTQQAATLVKEQLGEQLSLDSNYVGDVVLSSR